ncbi:VOC family protein [Streptomyces sp. NPDC050704]|uniref:VOC family protein n=1 Tax=Streptomyces sp. NPDC050704 TaxID=3157219 RepID=UPI00341B198D
MAGSEASAAFAEGVPCWVDAQLPDVAAGQRFYGELFGWTFEAFEEGYGVSASPVPAASSVPSVRALLEGEPVAALAPKRDGRMPTVWTVYFATPDAAALADRIEEAGGQVITAPVPVGPYGTTALAADPEGAVFGLWEGDTHPGFGKRHGPGSFGWAELYTRDTAAANSFYGDLFHEALFGDGATPDFGRAPVSDVFPAEMPPHFLVHFGVADCDAVLGTVVRLGGRIQAPPFDASYGRVAVVTDNQGASFAVLQR